MKKNYALLFLLAFTLCFSQQKQEGEIIISRENLISLLQKFKSKQHQTSKNKFESKFVPDSYIENNKIESIQYKLVLLENEINILIKKMDSIPTRFIFKDTVFIGKEKNPQSITYKRDSIQQRVSVIDTTIFRKTKDKKLESENTNARQDKTYESELAELNRKYDLLLANQMILLNKSNNKAVEDKAKVDKTTIKENTNLKEESISDIPEKAIEKKPKEITNQLESAKIVTSKTVIEVPVEIEESTVRKNNEQKAITKAENQGEKSTFDSLVEVYGELEKNVFFDNNSTEIRNEDLAILFDVITILNDNQTVDVFLEGFSSQKGNPSYNEKLSLKRTESVKTYLISKGIHPTRITSNYLGIDYQAKNEESARRVDVSFIVRK